VIVVDNFFTGSKDNLRKWIGHPRFELIRHGFCSHQPHRHMAILLSTRRRKSTGGMSILLVT
ncbi:hypothetical protein Taro_011667, partial [Colocasia esculenta]|nr:hypothetical protein [Colocasia esculenta]